MKLLSSEVIEKYDYKKTRSMVDEFMQEFEENYYRYINILPPSITSRLTEVKVQLSGVPTSKVESYVIKRIECYEEYEKYLEAILRVVENFSAQEQHFFKSIYFIGNTELMLEDELQCSAKKIIHIKKSCIIKFALAFNKAVLRP